MNLKKKIIVAVISLFSLIKVIQWIIGIQYVDEFTSAHAIAIVESIGMIALGVYTTLYIIREKKCFFLVGCCYLLFMPLNFSIRTAYNYLYLGYNYRLDHLILSYLSYILLFSGFVALLLMWIELKKSKNSNI